MLQVESLDVFHGDAQALDGVSLEVAKGAIVAIVGANGAGKTSLIRTIAGMYRPRRGRVVFHDQDIAGWPSFRVCDLGVGQVAEGRQVFPTLSVAENLDVGARPGHWTRERVFALFPRLKERLDNMGNQLSGGEQQMLSIARALLTNPTVLLMDEPTEGLAPVVVETLTAVLAALRTDSALSIILVEQNSRVALTFAPRTLILDKGRIVYDGASDPLRADPERLAKLIGIVE